MAIISDALNNVSDAGSSIVTMIGFKMSQKKVDAEHPLAESLHPWLIYRFLLVQVVLEPDALPQVGFVLSILI